MSVFIRLKEWKPACVFAQHTIINKFSFELSEGRCVSLLLHLQGCIQTLTALMLYKSCYYVHLFLELPDERKPYVICYADVVCIFVMYMYVMYTCTCMSCTHVHVCHVHMYMYVRPFYTTTQG